MTGLIAALDTADPAVAAAWAAQLAPHCGLMKVGLELFLASGPAGLPGVARRPVFLDLKLHDIPNTVAGAVRAVLPLRPRMMTLHAAGGSAMIEAACQAASGADRPLLLGVTVLTSLDSSALHATGVAGGPRQQVLRLARLAIAAGADGAGVQRARGGDAAGCAGRRAGAGRAGHPAGGRRHRGPGPDDDAAASSGRRGGLDRRGTADHPRGRSRGGGGGHRGGAGMTTRVKICGINSRAALDAAADAGADWIGYVFFAPSPRAVTPVQAAALDAHRRGPARVGLFVDPSDDEVARALDTVGLDVLQVHGAPQRAAALRARFGVAVWQVTGRGRGVRPPRHGAWRGWVAAGRQAATRGHPARRQCAGVRLVNAARLGVAAAMAAGRWADPG